ncbi:hypothetical protein BDN72DRAFT_960642 [Pluteus cervinus]|uniref:Uncharacterized protein n=1 Tax=Pluteus cervinus TaxID=181527 RepID=A0ACD3AQH4_9AGAR|nr:hypothetical protein BDN72DRAFT_960642 [Pluteus cervinus]
MAASTQYEAIQDVSSNPPTLQNTELTAFDDNLQELIPAGLGQTTNPDESLSQPLTSKPKGATTFQIVIGIINVLILPIVASAYLAFCFTAQRRVIEVNGMGMLDTSPERLALIKSWTTSVTILVISLGTLPLKGLLSDLKKEEFFRVLGIMPNGAPLAIVNNVTFASLLRSAVVVVQRKCSPYFTTAFIAGLATIMVSIIAPAALSVELVTINNELEAFEVGAIPQDSIYDTRKFVPPLLLSSTQTSSAGSIAWADTLLGLQYSFTADDTGNISYLVPYPEKLSTSTRASWLTDVIIIDPVCQWLQTSVTDGLVIPSDSLELIYVDLPTEKLSFVLPTTLRYSSRPSSPFLEPIYSGSIRNTTDLGHASTGYMLWAVGQCQVCLPGVQEDIRLDLDTPHIPTFKAITSNDTMQVGILGCRSNSRVETREVHHYGNGRLAVLPDQHPSQGNIDPLQARFLLDVSMGDNLNKLSSSEHKSPP